MSGLIRQQNAPQAAYFVWNTTEEQLVPFVYSASKQTQVLVEEPVNNLLYYAIIIRNTQQEGEVSVWVNSKQRLIYALYIWGPFESCDFNANFEHYDFKNTVRHLGLQLMIIFIVDKSADCFLD